MADCQIAGRAGSYDATRSRRYVPLEAVGELEEICVKDIAGFRPRRRGPVVSAKGPKTMFARSRPLRGAFAPTPNDMAAKLAEPALSLAEGLKQSSPKSRMWHRGSAAPKAEENERII